MVRFKKAVVDADQLCYSVGFAAADDPISHALYSVKKQLEKIQKQCGAETIELYVKGEGNFREEIAITHGYKAHRAATPKPPHYAGIMDYLVNKHKAIKCDGMEADDRVSIELYKDYIAAGGDRDKATLVLSSNDKDLNNTPGWHHNPRSGEIVWYSDLQSTRHFWYQMLTGDTADNIKGIPKLPWHLCKKYGVSTVGVGPTSAKKLMALTSSAEDAECFAYQLYLEWGNMEGYSEQLVKDYILENAQLLWMVRELDEAGNPVMFQINEELYERAKEQVQYTTIPDEGGDSTGGDRDNPYRVEGWEAEYTDQPVDTLRITPNRSR